jgi:RimJ/RimL family protein N-acetyltransferase
MSDVRLHEVTDEHFAWLLGERDPPDGLTEAPGGVDERFIVSLLRDLTASLHRVGCHGHWLIVIGKEVVGLCGFKRPPSTPGETEIGYGVAESRRGKGYASQAVALMLGRGRQEGASTLVAETAICNPASQLVLERNGFSRTGTRYDVEDGELILWAKDVPV